MKSIDLGKKLAITPVMLNENIESIVCLDSNIKIISAENFIYALDDRNQRIEKVPTVIYPGSRKLSSRFPRISIKEPFYDLNPNDHLFDRFELAKNIFLKQSEIKNEIVKIASSCELIFFLVVDGLSYLDTRTWPGVRPCLVDTLTTTSCGFKNIIGDNNLIATGLFNKGFGNFHGYSYWARDNKNDLTDYIFRNISNTEKVESFREVISSVTLKLKSKSYFQIVIQGLDGIAHKNRDEPLIEAIVQQLWNNVDSLVAVARKSNLKSKIIITSDHGILWKHRSNLMKIAGHSYKNHYHTRHYDSKILANDCMSFSNDGKNYSSLNYPYILRNLRSNEWGVHGGVSVEESITPFVVLDIN